MTRIIFLLAASILWWPISSCAEWNLLDGARVHPEYAGQVPRKSDVIFSTRFKRAEAKEAITAFGATRVEWVYSADPDFVASLRSVAPWFGGTVSSTISLPNDEGIAIDLDGKPIVAPWMKSWGAKWITTTSPQAREALYDLAKRHLDAGADSIQVDDPLLQYASASWGGDFSQSSLVGFQRFLESYPDQSVLMRAGIEDPTDFDYRRFLAETHGITTAAEYKDRFRLLPTTPLWLEYLKQTVVSHFEEFRGILDAHGGRRIPVSMNLSIFGPDEKRPLFDLVPFFDYAMVETKISDLDVVALQAATYRALGVGFVPSILPLSKAENRRAIAFSYALGAQPLVPWDVYMNNGPDKPQSRFFGYKEDYADLFRFVLRNAGLFNDLEELAVVGIVVAVHRYRLKETLALVGRLSRANVPFAIVPIGGAKRRYPIDRERIAHFKALIAVNPMSDFSIGDQSELSALPLKVARADDLSDEALSSLSPFLVSPKAKLRLIARGSVGSGKDKLVVHVLRANGGDNAMEGSNCKDTVGLRRDAIRSRFAAGLTVVWHTSLKREELESRKTKEGEATELPGCNEWGILEFAPL